MLTDAAKRDDLYAHIRREIEAFTPDLTTSKGRDAIKSLAFKITRTKTAIDAAGKKLNEDARAQINVVDAARRDARDTLDRLAEEVRRPLTEWEQAEEARQEKAAEALAIIADMTKVEFGDTAQTVMDRINDLSSLSMNPDVFRDALAGAEKQRTDAIATLHAAHDRLAREEADRVELERLRAEAAERERVAAEQRAEEERQAQSAAEAKVAEERRVAAERAEEDRLRKAAEAGAEAARAEEARKARAEQEERDRAHAEALAAERAKAAEAERLRQAEADRVAEIERQREAQEAADRAEAQRIADEQAQREKNRDHRGKVMGEVKAAIMSCGVDEPIAKAVVLAIVAGTVPHASIQF